MSLLRWAIFACINFSAIVNNSQLRKRVYKKIRHFKKINNVNRKNLRELADKQFRKLNEIPQNEKREERLFIVKNYDFTCEPY